MLHGIQGAVNAVIGPVVPVLSSRFPAGAPVDGTVGRVKEGIENFVLIIMGAGRRSLTKPCERCKCGKHGQERDFSHDSKDVILKIKSGCKGNGKAIGADR
jgi:hypothetical protein